MHRPNYVVVVCAFVVWAESLDVNGQERCLQEDQTEEHHCRSYRPATDGGGMFFDLIEVDSGDEMRLRS